MNYIKEIKTHQIIIDKSIFIGVLFPLTHIDDIKKNIAKAKEMFPKASHYCSASLYGEGFEHATSSDDGEPSRTAGVPILEVLKHSNITNVLCVVVRFFGGVKLGAGGLIRAYTKATSEVLKNTDFYKKKEMNGYEISFDYSLIQTLEQIIAPICILQDKKYLEYVTYQIYFKEKDISVLNNIKHLFINVKSLETKTLWILADTK